MTSEAVQQSLMRFWFGVLVTMKDSCWKKNRKISIVYCFRSMSWQKKHREYYSMYPIVSLMNFSTLCNTYVGLFSFMGTEFSVWWRKINCVFHSVEEHPWENTIKHDNNKFFSIQLEWKRTPRLLHQFGPPTANDYISNSLEIVMLQCVHIASFQFQKPQIRTFCERLWLNGTHEIPHIHFPSK